MPCHIFSLLIDYLLTLVVIVSTHTPVSIETSLKFFYHLLYSPYCVVRTTFKFLIGSGFGRTSSSSITTDDTLLESFADAAFIVFSTFPWSENRDGKEIDTWTRNFKQKWQSKVNILNVIRFFSFQISSMSKVLHILHVYRNMRKNFNFIFSLASVPTSSSANRWLFFMRTTYTHMNAIYVAWIELWKLLSIDNIQKGVDRDWCTFDG